MSMLGNITQYPYVFSITGDPLDGEPAEEYMYSTGLFSRASVPTSVSMIYGRLFYGSGVAGDYVGATYLDHVYPAIYEIAISGGSTSSSLFHVAMDMLPDPPLGTGFSATDNEGYSNAPLLLPDGQIYWNDSSSFTQTNISGTNFTTLSSDIYRATI
jgi:hypothetical protein